MKCNCEGCEYELEEAIRVQDNEGLCLATWINGYSYPDGEHFGLYMVDDEGRWQMG